MSSISISRRRMLSVALGAAAVTAAGPLSRADAATAGAARPAAGAFGPTITAEADSVFPEGIAWDRTRGAFLVTSTRQGTVSVVDGRGRVTPLVADPDPVIVSTLGVRADVRRNRLLVTYQDMGFGTRSEPGTKLTVSGLAEYDLATGRQLRLIDLAIGSSPIHAADRLVLDHEGTAYVVDPAAGYVYKVTADGKATVLVGSELLAPGDEGAGICGIALHPGGFLIVNHYTAGRLVRIPLDDPESLTVLLEDPALVGGDGSLLRPDGTLLVVTNQLAVPAGGQDSVAVVDSADGWTTARIRRDENPWPVSAPTDAALTPHGSYVLSGRADVLFTGGTSQNFVLRRF